MTQPSNKTVIRFDASSLRDSTCDLRWYLLLIKGYQSPQLNNDTLYGSAVHKFDATMYQSGGNLAIATKMALDLYKKPCNIKHEKRHLTEKHLLKTCFSMWEQFRKNDNFELLTIERAECFYCRGTGHTVDPKDVTKEQYDAAICEWCKGVGTRPQPSVELSFNFPVYEDDQLIIEASGTMDKLGRIKNGAFCIGDLKVTSSWDQVKFLRPFVMSPQFRFYYWALLELARLHPDSIFAEIAKTPVGIFIDAVFLSSTKDATFKRSEVQFLKPADLEEFNNLLKQKITQILYLFKHGSLDMPRDGIVKAACHNGYGFCRYFDVCAAPDRIAAEHILKRDFTIKQYNPLTFGGAE